MKKRPIGITIIALLVALAGILAAIVTLEWLGLFPWFGPGPSVRTFNLWYALLYGMLTWVYIWLFQMLWSVQEAGWVFIAVITIWNLTLGLLTMLGAGYVPQVVVFQMLLNAVVLIYIMLPGTRRAFGRA